MVSSILHEDNANYAGKWISRHFLCCLGLSVLTLIMEFIILRIQIKIDAFPHTIPVYMVKYVAAPTLMNFSVLGLYVLVGRKIKSTWFRALFVSLEFSCHVFVIYTVHLQYSSLMIGFAVAIMLTVIYGDFSVTTITAGACIILKIVSDAFIVWDSTFVEHRIYNENELINVGLSLLALGATYFFALLLNKVESSKQEMLVQAEQFGKQYFEETQRDVLTGVGNRKGLLNAAKQIAANTHREQYAFVMMDMDDFKSINDTYGHQVGDEYLRTLGKLLNSIEYIEAYRYGGDEFCLIFQGMEQEGVEDVCVELQQAFSDAEICQRVRLVSLSFGGAFYTGTASPEEVLSRADKALYVAKKDKGSVAFCRL